MAYPVYSTRFAQQELATGSYFWIAQPGFRTVLRDVDAANRSYPALMFVMGAGMQVIARFEVDGSTFNTFQWRGRQVFYAGENINFVVSSGEWDFTASGYQLTLP